MDIINTLKSFILDRLHCLKIPELNLSNQAIEEFDEIYHTFIQNGNGEIFTYTHSYPKYLFLNYIIENKNVLVHGSNTPDIRIFEPRDQTLFNGKRVKVVFASTDGIWSMFFAVINRKDYVGLLRNLCLTAKTKKGIKRYYYFSLNEEFQGKLWRNGMIYILPKDEFNRGGIKDEWICEKAVTPLAKLSIEPSDFIFSQDVKKHKETNSHIKDILKSFIFK